MVAAGPGIGRQELALETIHCRVFVQSAYAGRYEGLCHEVLVASSEGSLLHNVTPVQVKMCIKVQSSRIARQMLIAER